MNQIVERHFFACLFIESHYRMTNFWIIITLFVGAFYVNAVFLYAFSFYDRKITLGLLIKKLLRHDFEQFAHKIYAFWLAFIRFFPWNVEFFSVPLHLDDRLNTYPDFRCIKILAFISFSKKSHLDLWFRINRSLLFVINFALQKQNEVVDCQKNYIENKLRE